MSEDVKTYAADDPANPNNLVVRGADGDPVSTGTKMIEKESIERVVEGLKMAEDACQHLAKGETVKASIWIDIAAILAKMRRDAVTLSGHDLPMKQEQLGHVRGEAYSWVKARRRFLDGMKQATGGMRQLATCFRGDWNWSFMAQQLERHQDKFRRLLLPENRLQPDAARARRIMAMPSPKLILPMGFGRAR
jgi:hypothetical protein